MAGFRNIMLIQARLHHSTETALPARFRLGDKTFREFKLEVQL